MCNFALKLTKKHITFICDYLKLTILGLFLADFVNLLGVELFFPSCCA